MKRITIELLRCGEELVGAVYHPSGIRLFNAGEVFDHEHLTSMRSLGMEQVFQAEAGDDLSAFEQSHRYERKSVEGLQHGDVIAQPVFREDGTLLIKGGDLFSPALRDLLKRFRVREVSIEKFSQGRLVALDFLEKKKAMAAHLDSRRSLRKKLENVRMLLDGGQIDQALVDREIQRGDFHDAPHGRPLDEQVQAVPHESERSETIKRGYEAMFASVREHTEQVYRALSVGAGLDGEHVGALLDDLVRALIRDRMLLLCLNQLDQQRDYTIEHAVRVALLAINVCVTLGYSEGQVLEIGYAAILSDLGMVDLDGELLAKVGPLSIEERRLIETHPHKTLLKLRRMRNLPASVPVVISQIHERMDGSGYPRALSGDKIHRYARMLMICDTYDALITHRPYRGAMPPYRAIEQVLRLAHQKKFDAECVRGFLRATSLFPVGSFVRMKDGRIAKVVAANGEHFTRPVVRVLLESDGVTRVARTRTISLTEDVTSGISEALSNNAVTLSALEGL